MAVAELHTMTRPSPPALLTHVVNPLFSFTKSHGPFIQFQFLAVARKILVSFFIAISQVGPLLMPMNTSQQDSQVSSQQLDRLEALAKAQNAEISRLMQLDLTPFLSDAPAMAELRTNMKRWLLDNTIRSSPKVQDATTRSLQRRTNTTSGQT